MNLFIPFLMTFWSVWPQTPAAPPLHEFHTSIAEIEYNTKSKAFEVSLRVFIDDFEKAIGTTILQEHSAAYNPMIMKYLRQKFYLMNRRGKKKEMSLIGKEFKVDAMWLYIEIPYRESLRKAKFNNSILMEHFDDQVNILNLNYKGKKESFIFRKSNPIEAITIGQ